VLKAPASLQGRLLWLVLGASLLVWLAAALATWTDARHELDELLDSHLAQAAALLVAQSRELDHEESIDAPPLHRYAPRVAFQVFHEGRLVLRSANAPAEPMVDAGARTLAGFHTVLREGRSWRVFATRGAERDMLVFVGEQTGSRSSILWAVLRGMLWPIAVALPLLALVGWLAVRSGLRPLRTLGRTLAARPAEDLQPIALADAPTEMRPLLDALNNLFARIAVLLEGERRFTGDAAHELRTPIAAIRAQAQVALGAADDAERHRALQGTLAGCDRAARLVEQLLMLSRVEAEGATARQPADLGRVAQQVLADVAGAALTRQQVLDFEAAPGCVVAGDDALLAALCRNLVDNAIRYSPDRARIEVRVTRDGGDVVLAVDDSGAGLADAELARLGQRFFRAAGNEAPGSGLGWSIAQRIVATHGGSIRALRSSTLGGFRAEAHLPGAPDAAMRK
jgi:two-component system, OmpR family, sensor histidine kinase QseC